MNDVAFYSAWAEHYDAVFPPGPKPGFVAERFPAGARLLDLGCASGGMAFALAERGLSVHGLDLDPALVGRAQARLAASPLPGLSFARGDMLELAAPELPFDGALCLGNTLVHLLRGEQRVRALASMARAVRPGGALVLQIVNYDRVLDQGVDRLPTIERPGLRFERRYRALSGDGLIFEARLALAGQERALSVEQPLFPLRRAGLAAELSAAGWTPDAWYGGYDGQAWGPDTFACVVLAHRAG
jgi:glycine/sarcosine N-methyltransferase